MNAIGCEVSSWGDKRTQALGWLHHIMDVLSATESHALTWLEWRTLCYGYL